MAGGLTVETHTPRLSFVLAGCMNPVPDSVSLGVGQRDDHADQTSMSEL